MEDDWAGRMVDALNRDAYGGEWRKHLPPDDPRYSEVFDEIAEEQKDQSRRTNSAFFNDGSIDRLGHEWADYCRECIFLETDIWPDDVGDFISMNPKKLKTPRCKKLNKDMDKEWLAKQEKDLDCPMGTDRSAFIEKRTKEKERDYKESHFKHIKEEIDELEPEYKNRLIKELTGEANNKSRRSVPKQ